MNLTPSVISPLPHATKNETWLNSRRQITKLKTLRRSFLSSCLLVYPPSLNFLSVVVNSLVHFLAKSLVGNLVNLLVKSLVNRLIKSLIVGLISRLVHFLAKSLMSNLVNLLVKSLVSCPVDSWVKRLITSLAVGLVSNLVKFGCAPLLMPLNSAGDKLDVVHHTWGRE